MRRLAVWLACVSLLGWTALSPVSAQAPAGDAWRTITSDQGYSFQVPADWQQIPPNSALRVLNGVSCANPGFCVAVGQDCTILTSSDDHAWALQSGGSCPELDSVSCAGPSFCIAGGSRGTILTSSDGSAWMPQPSGAGDMVLSGVSCASPRFCVAVGGNFAVGSQSVSYQGVILTTADGNTWTPQPGGTDEWLFSVSCVRPSFCVAVGHNDTIVTTTDGSTWTVRQTGLAPGLSGYGPELGPILSSVSCASRRFCVAVGDKGTILTSGDGSTWTSRSGSAANLTGVSCPSPSFCVAVGDSGTILTSSDGVAWAQQSSHTHSNLNSVSCPSPSFCVAAGFDGAIVTSDDGSTWIAITAAGGWLQLPPTDRPAGFARQAQSPDGNEVVFAGVNTVSEAAGADPSRLARATFSDTSQGLLNLAGAPTVLQRPDAAYVPNADAAVALTEVASDGQGNSYVMGVRVATQGTTAFEFALSVPEDFYASDPSFGRILDSFQLTRPSQNPATSAPARPPAAAELSTVTSPQGYSFQVPSDWSQHTSDGVYQSPDGDKTAFAFAVPTYALSATAAATPIDLPRLAQEFVTQWNAGLVLSRGGPANIFQGPDPVQIPNADAGVALTEVVADPLGAPFVAGFRIAVQDAEVYIFALLVPEDFYASDPNFGKILGSFQLTSPSAFALSPEESVIALLPYKLSPFGEVSTQARQSGIASNIPASLIKDPL
jgi:photosystem II stability/assembly factor-like uncharacterized protein